MWIDGMGTAIIFEDNEKQISLIAESVDNDVRFMVEVEGRVTPYTTYEEALKQYIKTNICLS